ncbi:fimbrial protein [Citrobacter braakii]|nr:fimbrial protein [Citrobacter braakii]
MKQKAVSLMLAVLVGLMLTPLLASASRNHEKTLYLGVVNGQVQGNSVVKVTRSLPDPVLYNSDTDTLPKQLFIRNAEVRPASSGMVYLTVKKLLPENKTARITLKTGLTVDGQKTSIMATQQGEDVVITVPDAIKQVELRCDSPAELEVPVNYRGNLQIVLQVEE